MSRRRIGLKMTLNRYFLTIKNMKIKTFNEIINTNYSIMSVITNNSYLRISLDAFIKNSELKKNVCIIDIDSYTSICSIYNILKINKDSESYSHYLIKGDRVNSFVLSSATLIRKNDSFQTLLNKISRYPGHCYNDVLNILSTYISLSILSDQERLIFHQLKIENEIRQIAINLNLPIKSVYRSISSIGKKLNLTSIFSIRIFAKSLSPNIQTYEPIS